MADETIKLPIRSALIPDFYRKFHCLAQDCRDSCCVNWSITFDKKDYLRLRRLDAPAPLKERLEQGVRRERKKRHEGVFYGKFDLDSNGGRCPFLDPDGLCAIQRACGHEALPDVCTGYPRKIGYTPAAKEYALSPSCEGVLQQLWDLPEGVTFIEDPLPKAEQRTANISAKEPFTLFFAPLRSLFFDLLQDRAMSLTERMLYLGVIIQRLQKEDWDHFDPDAWRQEILSLDPGIVGEMTSSAGIAGNQDMYLLQNLKVLDATASKGRKWSSEIYDVLGVRRTLTVMSQRSGEHEKNAQITTNFSREVYVEALAKFKEAFSDREYFFENLMVAAGLYLNFPNLHSKEKLWKSYVSLCNLYSFYRFVSVLGCKNEPSKEKLFHFIAMASRDTLHSQDRFNSFQEELFQHNSSTLAHMAILLCWD